MHTAAPRRLPLSRASREDKGIPVPSSPGARAESKEVVRKIPTNSYIRERIRFIKNQSWTDLPGS